MAERRHDVAPGEGRTRDERHHDALYVGHQVGLRFTAVFAVEPEIQGSEAELPHLGIPTQEAPSCQHALVEVGRKRLLRLVVPGEAR